MRKIKFSVVVPVYNVEKYLEECIQSVLNQTYDEFELILVNDGSKDNSGSICDEYAEKDQRVKVYHKENTGMVHTRNYGIERSQGDYIISLDSDDLIVPWLLETVLELINKYNCEMVVYELKRFADKPEIHRETKKLEETIICDKGTLFKTILFDNKYNSLCKKAVKREIMLFKEKSLKTVCYSEDLLKTLDVLKMNPKTVFTNEVLYYYRKNENSVTQKLNVEQFVKDLLYVRAESYKLIDDEKVFNTVVLNEYGNAVINIVTDAIKIICRSSLERYKKISLLKQIKQSKLYTVNLKQISFKKPNTKGNKFVWKLFKLNMLNTLMAILIFKNRK